MVVDGVTQPRVSTFMNGFDDIERLEILKGPQGAIYGTNALGGIVNIVTKKPTQEQSARIKVKGGNNGRQDLNLSLQGGITDAVSARFNLIKEVDAFSEQTSPLVLFAGNPATPKYSAA